MASYLQNFYIPPPIKADIDIDIDIVLDLKDFEREAENQKYLWLMHVYPEHLKRLLSLFIIEFIQKNWIEIDSHITRIPYKL